jgi:hypothetical protein
VEVYLLRAQRRLALRPPSSDIAPPCCFYVLPLQQCVLLQIRPAAAADAAQVFEQVIAAQEGPAIRRLRASRLRAIPAGTSARSAGRLV